MLSKYYFQKYLSYFLKNSDEILILKKNLKIWEKKKYFFYIDERKFIKLLFTRM